MGTRLAVLGMAAAIGVGGVAVALGGPVVGVGAQAGDPATATTSADAGARHPVARRAGAVLHRALDGLVADDTLTQEQADKVLAATKAEAGATRTRRHDRRALAVEVAAKALGSTPDAVKAGVKGGTSIGAQADAANVDRQVVVDALTEAFSERIDSAVADGSITDEQATRLRGRLDTFVQRIVDADGRRRPRAN